VSTAVIVGHPDLTASRVNAALTSAAREASLVDVRVLTALYPDGAIDVRAEQAALETADHVVLLYPTYWYSPPAPLKRWLDEVMERGWAYGTGRPGALAGKTLRIVTTTGGEGAAYAPGELHSFEYDDAAEAFREAQRLDPGFALAYWGEALTYDHPIWGEHDTTAARAALARLAERPEQRIARGRTPRERAYLAAVEALYGEGALEARYRSYEAAMGRLQERYPDDLDAAALHALSLLTIRPRGTTDLRTTVRAAAICEAVLRRNPTHPGATHYLIHAYDDPVLAPLGLPVARRYARIAPRAEHALHMPSHIFTRLGLWQDSIASNEKARSAAHAEGDIGE